MIVVTVRDPSGTLANGLDFRAGRRLIRAAARGTKAATSFTSSMANSSFVSVTELCVEKLRMCRLSLSLWSLVLYGAWPYSQAQATRGVRALPRVRTADFAPGSL